MARINDRADLREGRSALKVVGEVDDARGATKLVRPFDLMKQLLAVRETPVAVRV